MSDDGGESAGIKEADLRRLVLQPKDLPSGFTRFDFGPIKRFDLRPGPRGALDRFGRTGGWRARYKRSGTVRTPGPLVVGSFVDAFSASEGAEQDLAAYREEAQATVSAAGGSARMLDPPDLGDEAIAYTLLQPGKPGVRFFTVAWRSAATTASIEVSGFERRVTLAHALRLARRQHGRLQESA